MSSGAAAKVIKTWENRFDEEEYVESGVDDEVRLFIWSIPYHPSILPLSRSLDCVL